MKKLRLFLLISTILYPLKLSAAEEHSNISFDLNFEQLRNSTIGLGADYLFDDINLMFGVYYNTNRSFKLISPNILSLDYLKIKAEYKFPIHPLFQPYLGIGGRVASVGTKSEIYPDLKFIESFNWSIFADFGANLKISEEVNLYIDLFTNYPASYPIPYFSWGLGGRYRF